MLLLAWLVMLDDEADEPPAVMVEVCADCLGCVGTEVLAAFLMKGGGI